MSLSLAYVPRTSYQQLLTANSEQVVLSNLDKDSFKRTYWFAAIYMGNNPTGWRVKGELQFLIADQVQLSIPYDIAWIVTAPYASQYYGAGSSGVPVPDSMVIVNDQSVAAIVPAHYAFGAFDKVQFKLESQTFGSATGQRLLLAVKSELPFNG
jgi:hypothetical protein